MPIPERCYDRLKGSRVIITGAGSQGSGIGIGKAISYVMAAEGARVALLDREPDRAAETKAMITAKDGVAHVIAGDVTVAADCDRMVLEAVSWLGGLDVLVNNVGLAVGSGRLDTVDPAAFRSGLDVNLTSAFLMTRAAIPSLLASRSAKCVVNIASIAGMSAYRATCYGPAKAALIQFTRELALLYGRDGLRVNAIAPGHILTPMVESLAQIRTPRRNIAPLGLEGDAWDVAQAALFLAGNESRFITGVCLPVDGGVTSVGPLAAFGLANS